MSRSVLLQLARDSIEEVLEARRTIDINSLLQEHPLLNEPIPSRVNIYLNKKLRGSYAEDANSLIEGIILNAKKSAFEDSSFSPISTSQYLSCEIEIVLETKEGLISEKDAPIIEETSSNTSLNALENLP